jgi:hypothetical protein
LSMCGTCGDLVTDRVNTEGTDQIQAVTPCLCHHIQAAETIKLFAPGHRVTTFLPVSRETHVKSP